MKYGYLKNPQPFASERYRNTAKKISGYFSNIPQVLSIYQMGNISVPGISDLDILTVIKDRSTIPHFDVSKILNEREKYTLMHGIFVGTETFWRHRHFFYIYDNLKLLEGEDFVEPAIDLSPEFRELLLKRFAIQHIIKVYVSISAQLSVYSLKVRPLLCELHALRYDEQALSDWLPAEMQTTFRQYCQTIAQLRKTWFDLPPKEACRELLTICRELPLFLDNLLLHLNQRLNQNGGIDYNPERPLKLAYHRYIFCGNRQTNNIKGANPSLLRWLGMIPIPMENLRIKIHNRLSAYRLEIPADLFAFVANDFYHPLYEPFQEEIQTRQAILNEYVTRNISKMGYALPVLDFIH